MADKIGTDEYGEILIYQTDDGQTNIEVKIEDDTVWLTQQQMSELFQTSRTNVVEHIKHIYEEGELDEISTCRNFRQVRKEGNREVTRQIPHYNLDMIISLGYRIKSVIATRFRQWATKRLKEYMIKGFTIDDERLKVHTAYIAEVKRDLGLPMYDAPNAVEELKQPRKHPTAEKVEAIKDALRYFEIMEEI